MTAQTLTLTDFLLARIAEREEAARDAAGWDASGRARATGQWARTGISSIEDDERRSVVYSDNNQLSGTVADHIALNDPAYVLAECEAKRRIVERERGTLERYPGNAHARYTLRDLGTIYADHPDYDESWRP